MKLSFADIIKYSLSFLVAAALFAYLYKDQDFGKMLTDLSKADFTWIIVSVLLSLISHWSRGWRWVIALRGMGYQTSIFRAFLAIFVGYIANLMLPRMGEVSRCVVFQRTDDVPFQKAFGSVLAERAVDLIMLFSAVLFTLFWELDRLSALLNTKFGGQQDAYKAKLMLLAYILLPALILGFLLWYFRKKLLTIGFVQKIAGFLGGIKEGFLSIMALNASARWAYVAHTFVIWVCYYYMTYVLFFSMPETAHLDWLCGFTVLAMGGIAMAVPVQGGIGVYHYLVSGGVQAYGVEKLIGDYFAVLIHGSQVVTILFFGTLALALMLYFASTKKKKQPQNIKSPNP
ncbi:MAG: UPF0104 family protein [Cytophagales bacterium]|nr:MAG: UPF0104 family protein [Cytophagales bacterium]TAF60006.1 MAG: UPF0104 family protein [Cytophagales bacterium]